MTIENYNNISVAIIEKETKIENAANMLDLMANIIYQHDVVNLGLVIYKESLSHAFFDLKSGFAGEMLQKFSNYQVKLAIVGDFLEVKSKSLKDFIFECNRGNQIFFLESIDDARSKYMQI
jgi:hypothetical protein